MGEMNGVNVSEMGLLEFQEYCESVNVSEMDMHEFAMFCKSMDTAYGYDRADKKVYGTDKMRAFAIRIMFVHGQR